MSCFFRLEKPGFLTFGVPWKNMAKVGVGLGVGVGVGVGMGVGVGVCKFMTGYCHV